MAAAVAAVIGALVFIPANEIGDVIPVLIYLTLLGVPGIFGSIALLARNRVVLLSAWIIHELVLVVLLAIYILAWMLSPGSGIAATPFLLAALCVNGVSSIAVRQARRIPEQIINTDAQQGRLRDS
jgi:hypothetical protein